VAQFSGQGEGLAAMFAPRTTRAQAKVTENASGKPALRHAIPAVRHFAGSTVGQATIGQAEVVAAPDHAAVPGRSWNFSKVSVFPPPPNDVRTELAVGRVDDPLEQEANRVADQVIRTPDTALSITAASARPSRKHSAGEEGHTSPPVPSQPTSARRPTGGTAPDIVRQALNSPGTPLDAASRAFFEPRFGQDFSTVRIHTDGEADRSAQAIGARAFTLGRHVVFGSGQFAPHAPEGKLLLAHELAHVVQQSGGTAGSGLIRRQAAPAAEPDWREQARNKVPYQQWTTTQKEAADRDYHAALRRMEERGASGKIDFTTYDSDNELFKLLHPYQADMRGFYQLQTRTYLDTSATWVADFQYESQAGKPVTLKARVEMPAKQTSAPTALVGDVLFEIFNDIRQIDLHRVPLTGACTPPSANNPCGAATYVTVALPKDKYRLKVTYQPLNTGNRPSYTEAFLNVL
jgi:Domain of unknown function (DUF4157)